MRRWFVSWVGLLWVCCFLTTFGQAFAEVRLAGVFGSGMVFQQNKPVPIWGQAPPHAKVMVSFRKQHQTTQADRRGNWRVTLSKMLPGQPAVLVVKSGASELRFSDVVVGEVWLCSGQSNMSWPLYRSDGGKRAIALPENVNLRLFRLAPSTSRTPKTNIRGRWVRSRSNTRRWFSGVCYFFGVRLQRALRVPIGLIQSAVGGTVAEAWTPHSSLVGKSILRPILERQRRRDARTFMRKKRWQEAMVLRRKNRSKTSSKAASIPRLRPPRPALNWNRPSGLYNAMIHPLIPYAIRGVLWYQGESNLGRALQYRTLLSSMIRGWRSRWKQGDFPFFLVELAPFRYRWGKPSWYNELCASQHWIARYVRQVGIVGSNDVGNIRDIHPRNKRRVGERLATLAMARVYRLSVVSAGPTFRKMERKGNALRLFFDGVGSGLVLTKESRRWFQIAGKDKRFVQAQVRLDQDKLLVWSPRIRRPVAVRFAWRDDAVHGFANREGWPASSFRTDSWRSWSEESVPTSQ